MSEPATVTPTHYLLLARRVVSIGWVLHDESGKLVSRVHHVVVSAGSAGLHDAALVYLNMLYKEKYAKTCYLRKSMLTKQQHTPT